MRCVSRVLPKRVSGPELTGFTLIELLICFSITLVIAAFLIPVMIRAAQKANGVNCLSNLHQITVAASAGNGSYGAGPTRTLRCPSNPRPDGGQGYGVNGLCGSLFSKQCPQPARTVWILESQASEMVSSPPKSANALQKVVDVTRHGNAANYLFDDGHAQAIDWTTIQKTYNAQHNFIDPAAAW